MGSTSRVFAAARETKTRIAALAIPAASAGLRAPQVALAKPDPTAHEEIIWVRPEVGDDGSIVVAKPCVRDEEFDVTVEFWSDTGSVDDDAILDRLEAVCDLIQAAFHDVATGKPIPLTGATKMSDISQVNFAIFPKTATDDLGIERATGTLTGVATITIRPKYRI